MPKIRAIHPEFWTDEKVVEGSPLARLLFIGMWNDLLQQMIYLNSEANFTIALGLSAFRGSLQTDWSKLMCATCMSFVPGVIFYLIGQKYFVEGIVMTGLKN